jgi:putative transposase
VSASAYYQRRTGRRSARAVGDERLLERIERVHAANCCCYGYRRTWPAPRRAGVEVGRDRVKRLLRAHGIQGAKRRGTPWGPRSPTRPPRAARIWCSATSRRRRPIACGWRTSPICAAGRAGVLRVRDRCLQPPRRRLAARAAHAHDAGPRRAADGALASPGRRRRASWCTIPTRAVRAVHQLAFTQVLDNHGVLASIGSVGDAFDNALAESVVDSFKTELIADRVWRTRTQLELAVVEYVGWFQPCAAAWGARRHPTGRVRVLARREARDFARRIGRGARAKARRTPQRASA